MHHLTMGLNRGHLAQRCVARPECRGQTGQMEVLLRETRHLPALAVTRMPWTKKLTHHRARNRVGEALFAVALSRGRPSGSLWALGMKIRMAEAPTGWNMLLNRAPTERESAQPKKIKQLQHQPSRGGVGSRGGEG